MGDPLDDAADAVADGRQIDWARLEQECAPSARETVVSLRRLASLTALHTSGAAPRCGTPPFGWGTLEVRELIARGVHGTLYRAWDPRLEREVGLKLLHESAPNGVGAIHEGRLLARIRHPNVVTVYGADFVDGQAGIWMEFVRGRTMRQIVDGGGPLAPADAVRVVSDVCGGLEAVHAAGLLHRDINAQNVMRDEAGHTILMDLGAGNESTLTPAIEGSPVFLAPEVLDGRSPTAASDVYAAGVLLFFLLTGRYPVAAGSLAELRERLARGPVERLLPGGRIAASLCAVVNRAIALDESDRFESADALRRALDGLPSAKRRTAAVALLGVAGATIVAILALQASTRGGPAAFAEHDWVLVTDFENRTGNADLDGVADALAYDLSDSSYLNVVPRVRVADALQIQGRTEARVDAALAAAVARQDTGIKLIVDGTVEPAADGTAFHVRVVEPGTGRAIADVGQLVPTRGDVVTAASQLSLRIRAAAGEPRTALRVAADRLRTVHLPLVGAARAYAAGRTAADRGDWKAAAQSFSAATSADPEFALAYAFAAWSCRNRRHEQGECRSLAREALNRIDGAVERDRLFIRATYEDLNDHPDAAIAEFRTLVERYPDDLWGVRSLISSYALTGSSGDQSVSLYERLARIRPNDFTAHATAAQFLNEFRGVASARPEIDRATQLIRFAQRHNDPSALRTYTRLFSFHELWAAGRITEASAALDAVARQPEPDDAPRQVAAYLASARAALGQLHAAGEVAAEYPDYMVVREWSAIVALGLGDMARVRDLMRAPLPDLAPVSLLIRAGDLDEAERVFSRVEPLAAPEHAQWSRQEIALARGSDSALSLAQAQRIPWMNSMKGVRTFMYSETLASALRARGRTAEAISVLEQTSTLRENLFTRASHNGYFWMRIRKLLADVYRDAGRVDDARAVEQELLRYLAVADRDNPMLLDLQRRAARQPAAGRQSGR